MIINIEDIIKAKEVLNNVNRISFGDLIFLKGGVPVEENEYAKQQFKFTRLNNTDYILMEIYKGIYSECLKCRSLGPLIFEENQNHNYICENCKNDKPITK